MRILVLSLSIFILASCSKSAEFKTGNWRGVIELQGKQLPFNFEVVKEDGKYKVYLTGVTQSQKRVDSLV